MSQSHRTLLATASITAALSLMTAAPALAQYTVGDREIDGSLCVGNDCVNGEAFGFDTIRLKENNLRIKFDDTSSTASFPPNDWQIRINDSANGGASYFAVEDVSGGRTPFRVSAGARSNALFVDSQGDVGIGTSTPATDIDIKIGDTPTVRLQQDGTSGFTPQTWDMAGNETSFFIRDATGGSTLPFRIMTGGAPSQSLVIDADGHVGIGAGTDPEGQLEVASGADGTNIYLTNNSGSWRFNHNASTGRLNIRRDGGNTPVKIDEDADENLLLVGTNATDQIDITGNLIVSGDCSEQNGACADYVFGPDHVRLTLPELRAFITENSHLPNVPSEAHIKANGVNMAHFTGRLLEKIEELALYTLEQEEVIQELRTRVEQLEAEG